MITFACISQREAEEWVAALRMSKSELELLHEKERGALDPQPLPGLRGQLLPICDCVCYCFQFLSQRGRG
jgi:hypothetical protein